MVHARAHTQISVIENTSFLRLYLVLFKCFDDVIFHFHKIISVKSLY